MDAEHVQHRLDLIAAGLIVLVLLYLLFGGFHLGSHHHKAATPTLTPTAAAPSAPPTGGTCPAGKVPVTIGDETGDIAANTTPEQIAATVSHKLLITVTPADITEKNPGLIRNGRTTAGFNGDQCLNY